MLHPANGRVYFNNDCRKKSSFMVSNEMKAARDQTSKNLVENVINLQSFTINHIF